MTIAEYSNYDGLGLAGLVRRGEVSAAELLEEALRRVELHNSKLNAVVFRADDLARDWAKEPADGPFQGVPLLLKDILALCQGMPTRMGSASVPARVSKQDSEIVLRLRQAGFVPFGKTNAPEFGLMPTTESVLYGAALNPWDLRLSPGGSSGGSAVAVAAGIVPVAHCNDGGGSIRIPASCCGLVGLKPTRGRSSLAPGSDPSGLTCEGVLTRSVRDSAAALDAIVGSIPGDFFYLPAPGSSFLRALDQPIEALRIGLLESDPFGRPYADACSHALQETVALLSGLGHRIEPLPFEIEVALTAHAFRQLWYSNAAVLADGMALAAGREAIAEQHDPLTWAMVEAGRGINATQYQIARVILDNTSRRVAEAMRGWDVVLSPTLSRPPWELGYLDLLSSDAEAMMDRVEGLVAYAPLANSCGLPAISLPLQTTPAGLPIGLQFMAAAGEEALLLRLARQLEEASPWQARLPAMRTDAAPAV